MNPVKKIIVYWDKPDGFLKQVFEHDKEEFYPFAMGKLSPLISENAKLIVDELLLHENNSLFNKNDLAKLTINVGKHGLYYLRIRPDYKLVNLSVIPNEVQVDIFFGDINSLVYGFYNSTSKESITVSCKLEKDTENIYQKIKSNPDDIIYRNYFIVSAMNNFNPSTPLQGKELDDNKILSAQDAADYIGVSKKTIHNIASLGNIKKLRGGKYRKKELDLYLEGK